MTALNKVFLIGNLTCKPELHYTASGAAFASFGLAVNHKFKQGEEWKDEVCFVDITVWAKQGEDCAQYLNKGSFVFIDGRLSYRAWEGGSKLEVVVGNVQFLDKKNEGS
jgi:single-strand DNA-binding protein